MLADVAHDVLQLLPQVALWRDAVREGPARMLGCVTADLLADELRHLTHLPCGRGVVRMQEHGAEGQDRHARDRIDEDAPAV